MKWMPILLVAWWAGAANAPADTGWVERLEINTPPLLREQLASGVLLQFGDDEPAASGGVPDLPSLVRPLSALAGYSITAVVVETESRDETGVRVAPSKDMRRTLVADNKYQVTWVREPTSELYARNMFWPESLVQVDQAWQGSNRLARLVIRPVQWNPKTEVLRIHERLVVDLVYQPE
jgi:hypothetical protein